MQLARKLPEPLAFTPETTFRLSEDTFVEPDFVVYENPAALEGLDGPSSLLAIEVGDSSLAYDRGRKALIYAAFGVRELWVIDAVRLETRVFLEPMPLGCIRGGLVQREPLSERELAKRTKIWVSGGAWGPLC